MHHKELRKNTLYLIQRVDLSDIDKTKLKSYGYCEKAKIKYLHKSIFGYPISFLIDTSIIAINKKIFEKTVLVEIKELNADNSISKKTKK